ncbi:MAG: hypothetical protein J7494_01740 [Sphingobium sp.]|nr:hypothetical protein [Sphingobium sp.]
MRQRGLSSRIIGTVSILAAATAMLVGTSAGAQKPPADLTVLPPTPTDYTPKKTSWGDWDFTGTWPIENIASTRILFQRQKTYGNRIWITKEEHDKRIANASRSDGSYNPEGGLNAGGTQGLADWVKNSNFSWRTSMLVKPADGQLPPLTPKAEALYKAGRSGWVPRQEFDWVDDFDSWDRCISRGFPASMFPFRYNYGQRIWQTPGYVVIQLEMLGTRVIPLDGRPKWPGQVEAWMGSSRGHWEGKTLVIETTNIKSGDSATHDPQKRAASPLNMATQNVPPFNTIPTSTKAHTVERLTMTGPNSILYEITYDDPEVFTKPWTAQLEWSRDDKYEMPEYACHEGDVQVRNYISASRAHRKQVAAGESKPIDTDTRDRFAQQFDFDPVAPVDPNAPRPAPRRGQ